MSLSSKDYYELIARKPSLRPTDQVSPKGIPTQRTQPDKGSALERPLPRKEKSSLRFKIHFDIYAVRPLDWDNHFTKPLQDLVAQSGIIPGDKWDQLEGSVASYKVYSPEEERTEITITQLT